VKNVSTLPRKTVSRKTEGKPHQSANGVLKYSYNMCLYTQEYWRKGFSKIAKNDKNRNFYIFCWPPKFTKKRFLKFFDVNQPKELKKTQKWVF
jgi:hypothetical protein